MVPTRRSPGEGLTLVARRMPLEWKVPLLMSAVLAIVLAIILAATYGLLRGYAVRRVEERIVSATRQIATSGATNIGLLQTRYRAVANDPVIQRAVAGRGGVSDASVRAALERLLLPADSNTALELRDAGGRRVAHLGPDLLGDLVLDVRRPEVLAGAGVTLPTFRGDSIRFSDIFARDGRAYYWTVMPVMTGGRYAGYIAHQRRLAVTAQTERALRDLSGDSISLYYRTPAGSLWLARDGVLIEPLRRRDTVAHRAELPTGETVLFHEERIGRSAFVVGLQVPESAVLAAPRRSVQALIAVVVVLMIAGVIAAWLIGRSVARPLGDIARAAAALGHGEFDTRVPEQGDVEVRRLAESFNRMAQEIGASRAALERQTEEARAANSAKSEFLTVMSHELRTPLNAIGGYVDLLEMQLRGPLTEAQRQDLARIKASQQHLLGLISSVLDLARIEAGRVQYDLTEVGLDEFIAGLEALIGPQVAAKRLTLRYHAHADGLGVVADREKLRQVMLNLLSNAIRHTPPDGTITVTADPHGMRVQVVVQDTGPGIPPARRQVIFEPFVQLDRSLAHSREGMGLGLAISRDLARGMSGDLEAAESATGARFVLTLPAALPGRVAPSPLPLGESTAVA